MHKPTKEDVDAFACRAIANLPDSLEAQQAELLVLVNILPKDTRGRSIAREMLHGLNIRARAQSEFCFQPEAAR